MQYYTSHLLTQRNSGVRLLFSEGSRYIAPRGTFCVQITIGVAVIFIFKRHTGKHRATMELRGHH